jgi:hypothetical protein
MFLLAHLLVQLLLVSSVRGQVVAPGSEAECDLMHLFAGLQSIASNEACRAGCETARGDCPAAWTPTGVDVCTSECGAVFEPFWDVCGSYLISAGLGGMDDMGRFCELALSRSPQHHTAQMCPPARVSTRV